MMELELDKTQNELRWTGEKRSTEKVKKIANENWNWNRLNESQREKEKASNENEICRWMNCRNQKHVEETFETMSDVNRLLFSI